MNASKGPASTPSQSTVRNAIVALAALFGPMQAISIEGQEPDKMIIEGNVRGDRMWAHEDGQVHALTESPITERGYDLEETLERTPKNRSAMQALLAE